jgi:RimJ/RimL family protein N-acetyltransferase
MNIFDIDIILENDKVLLRPLQADDIDAFREVAFDEDTWRYTVTKISNEEELQDYMLTAFRDRETGFRYPFTIIDKQSGKVAGSTSYGNISIRDKRLEIGWTWLATAYRGKGLNAECKKLLLEYAFNELKMERVEFKTDALNMRSRKAILKLGTTEEGVLRSHTLMHDGRRRDSIYFGILKSEWMKMHLPSKHIL